MDYLKDEDVWPLDTIVRLKKTHEFARIVSHTWLRPEIPRYFLHYSVEIEDRGGPWCLLPGEADLECLPLDKFKWARIWDTVDSIEK